MKALLPQFNTTYSVCPYVQYFRQKVLLTPPMGNFGKNDLVEFRIFWRVHEGTGIDPMHEVLYR